MKKTLASTQDIVTSKQALTGILVLILISVLTMFLFDWIGVDTIRGFIMQGGPLAPLLYIGFKSLTYIIAPLSGGPIMMLSGSVFGPWLGTLYSLLGDVLGGSVNFLIAHYLGRAVIQKFVGKKGLEKVDEYYDTVGQWKGLLFARFFLSSFYDFISYAAGLTKLRFLTYLVISILGGILPTMYGVFVGASLVENRPLFFGMIGVSLALLGLMYLLQKYAPVEKGEK